MESILDNSIRLQVAQIVSCTEAEGPGRRLALWFQGCPLRCPGCWSGSADNVPPRSWSMWRRLIRRRLAFQIGKDMSSPAPSGTYGVRRIVKNPTYHYDPKFQFKGVRADRKLTIAPGPNNPVGLVWIDLTAPSYGIHGTPAPEDISKTQSHGCIRLTNWDAVDLATMTRPGTSVSFEDEDTSVAPLSNPVGEQGRPEPKRQAP